jgi:hypothetical protein
MIQTATQWNKIHGERRREISRLSARRVYRRDPQKAMRAVMLEYHTNLNYHIAWNLRAKVRMALHGRAKTASTLNLLGCSLDDFIRHLESLFTFGMTWENYGLRGWHIDHKRPCASFDLSQPAQQRACFHYTNLQPLWAFDNLSKGNRI